MAQGATPSSGLTFESGSRNTGILHLRTRELTRNPSLRDIELPKQRRVSISPSRAAQIEVVSESVKESDSELQ